MIILLYIDPGTGSMLLSIFLGLAAAAVFGIRLLIIKLQFFFTRGKIDKSELVKSVPYLIFSDHKRYWNVFEPVCREFGKRGIDVLYYTESDDDPALTCDLKNVHAEYIGVGNRAFARLNVMNADIVLATTPHLEVYQWKRSKNVKHYSHIPHTVDDLSGYRMFGLDYYDSILTTGPNQQEFVRKIEKLRPAIKEKELVMVGSVQLDGLKSKLERSEVVQHGEKPIVLVAPSWGVSAILSRYGEDFLSALVKTDYHIIVRPHPQTLVSEPHILKPLQEKFTEIEWNFDNDNFDVMNRSDILITDFSGVILEYSLVFNKPLIYADTHFDTLPYDADWIDEKRWALRAVEKLGVELKEEDFGRIGEVIENAMDSTRLQQAREEARKECWEYVGQSAERIVDWAVKKREEILIESK